MNFPSLLAGRLRIAAPPQLAVLLAVLLTIALAGSALAQETPPTAPGGPPSNPAANQPSANPPIQPPTSPPSNPPGTSPSPTQPTIPPTNPPSIPPTNPMPTNPTPTNPTPTNPTPAPHPQASSSPSGNCIVSHAATPAQLCRMAGGLQFYFIGADGSSHTGPWLAPFSDLAALHPSGASVSLYTGANSFTGKPIQIYYLPAEQKIRISTYYPDTQYDTNKPYVYTVDSAHSVNHEAW